MRLALALTSAQADRLRKEADRLGIAPAVLARATLEDLCDLPDAGFRAAAERIVPKNQELSLASPDAVSDACRDPRATPRDAGAVRWHAGHSRSGCPARCAGPAAPPWRPFSRCMVSASRRHAGISGLNATRLVWLRLVRQDDRSFESVICPVIFTKVAVGMWEFRGLSEIPKARQGRHVHSPCPPTPPPWSPPVLRRVYIAQWCAVQR